MLPRGLAQCANGIAARTIREAQASATPGESYPPPGTLASKNRSVEHFGENRFADHISCMT